METPENNGTGAQGATTKKERPKAYTLTIEQIEKLAKNELLFEKFKEVTKSSENVDGKTLFKVAELLTLIKEEQKGGN